jgi:hypothetical protein
MDVYVPGIGGFGLNGADAALMRLIFGPDAVQDPPSVDSYLRSQHPGLFPGPHADVRYPHRAFDQENTVKSNEPFTARHDPASLYRFLDGD